MEKLFTSSRPRFLPNEALATHLMAHFRSNTTALARQLMSELSDQRAAENATLASLPVSVRLRLRPCTCPWSDWRVPPLPRSATCCSRRRCRCRRS
jgi:hypothetical protein